jgi:hypothetical protein
VRRRHLQRSRGTGRHSHFAHTRTARGRRARATPPHTTRYPLRARLLRARAHPRPHFPRVAGRPPPLLSPEAHELILFVCVHATCPRERLVVVPQGRVWTDRAGGGRRQLGGACERPAAGIRSGAGCGARRPARWTHTSASRARTESSTTSAAPSPLERSVLCRWAEPRARAASPRGARGVLLACSRGEAASGVLHRRPARRRRAASAGRGGAAVWRPGLYSPRSHVERVQQVAAGEAPAREGGREGDRDRERERERERDVLGAGRWAGHGPSRVHPCPGMSATRREDAGKRRPGADRLSWSEPRRDLICTCCGAFCACVSYQVGGTMFHSFKGARNAPRGERMAGAVEAVKANARRLGGSFAVWGGLFSTFDCCFLALRSKEDPYNSIVSLPPSLIFALL